MCDTTNYIKENMIRHELPIAADRFTKDYYVKNDSDYINMHEVSVFYKHAYNFYLVFGFTGYRTQAYFSIVHWRSEWHGQNYPKDFPIIKSELEVIATNNTGTLAFNKDGIYFLVIPLRN